MARISASNRTITASALESLKQFTPAAMTCPLLHPINLYSNPIASVANCDEHPTDYVWESNLISHELLGKESPR